MLTVEENEDVQMEEHGDHLESLFAQAIERHQAEDWQAAEHFYRQVLAAIPEQPNANYNLGMLKMQLNQSHASLEFFKTALTADENEAKYWLSYVEALTQAGQQKEAVAILMQGIERGLHGDEVDNLVAQLTKPLSTPATATIVVNPSSQTPIPTANSINDRTTTKLATSGSIVMPTNVIHYASQPSPMVITQSIANNHIPAPSEKKSEGNSDKPAKAHGMNAYLDNPQVKQMLALQSKGKYTQAKKQGTGLLKFFPNNPVILSCLGMIAIEQGDYAVGVSYLEQSLAVVAEQTTALSYLSIAYTKLNKLTAAIAWADKAIALNPTFAEAHANRGNALHALRRYEEAADCYKKAIDLKPGNVGFKFNLGETYKLLKQYEEAANYLQQGLLLNPKDIAAQLACGDVLIELERYEEALNCYNAIINMNHNHVEALFRRGLIYIKTQDCESACADLTQVIHLNPHHEQAYLNLGVALRDLGRYDEAYKMNEMAISQQKSRVQAYNNQALLLVDMQRFDEALDCYNTAIAIAPQHQETYWNKALLLLLLGQYSQGWALYESRWKSVFKQASRHFSKPLWLGNESLAGKTILIYGEQGLGDDIQFSRYITELEKLGAKVILDVHKPLVTLMASLKGDFTIVESESDLSDFDYHCPMMSLPTAFKTQLDTIPAHTPYLYANEDKVKEWQNKLGKQTTLRVGLVWSGSLDHKNDHNRSLSLEMFKPLLALPVEFHALQKEIRPADMQTLSTMDGLNTHQTALQDFSDTAALISQLDLVITVDTSVAHLAGAMNKECWVLLPHSPDFRWLLERNDSPWYPSITLFRQAECHQWQPVIDTVKGKLQKKAKEIN